MKNRFLKLFLIIGLIIATTIGVFAFSFRNMTLDFIHISDTHITSRESTPYKALGSSKDLLLDAVDQINLIKGLDFVLFTGDMVDTATQENYFEYYRIISKLKYPTLNAFGNHDFYGMNKDEALALVKYYNPNYQFDTTYYAFSPKTDYRIIILDGTIIDSPTPNGLISDEQLDFLKNELSQNQDKIVVIAMHFASVEPFVAQEHSLLNASKFNEILAKYKNPIVVLSGHYHATKIRHYGNLMFVSTPSMVTYPMGFRHIKITNYKDRVHYKFDFVQTRLKDILEENRQTVISYGTLAGFEKDRNYEYIYKKRNHKSTRYKLRKIKNVQKESTSNPREIKKLTKPTKEKKNWFKKKTKKIQEATTNSEI